MKYIFVTDKIANKFRTIVKNEYGDYITIMSSDKSENDCRSKAIKEVQSISKNYKKVEVLDI